MSDGMSQAPSLGDVLTFWYETCVPKQWFKKDPSFDQAIRKRFEGLISRGLQGDLNDWMESRAGCLALILVLDQFTRNVYRDTPKAFCGDTRALAVSHLCCTRGYLNHSEHDWRHFMLLPMMHSEELSVQERSLPLFEKYTDESVYRVAIRHHAIIERFGRYPHRNPILGRDSTPEELAFLKEPGSTF